ncbi:MAG: hypothetical protein ABSH20_02570 [Tepidisphaeraceae bacterium]|jgi:cytochrome P450
MSDIPDLLDPFGEARNKDGVLQCPFQGEIVPMILRHADVREAAKDWRTFSSDAPFRVPIPSEEEVRTIRQLPIETDPPEHTDYRAIIQPFFQRAKQPEVIAKVEGLVARELATALEPHARLIVRGLLLAPTQRVAEITVLETREHIEREAAYHRSNGFDALIVRLTPC